MTDTQLTSPQGSFEILRYPQIDDEKLRAWDAADEYLLEHMAEKLAADAEAKVLIINDSFGALSVALHAYEPVNYSDSFVAQQAAQKNLENNDIPQTEVKFVGSTESPTDQFDFVVIKVPKTLALLEDQLSRIQETITEKTQIIAAGMVKNLSKKAWKILEKYLGPTSTSLAKKKARLIFVEPDMKRKVPTCPYPVMYQLEETEYQICNHANVFSRDSLDIGTRLLLENLPDDAGSTSTTNIIDLGCGNGVVGLLMAVRYPQATIQFVDESYMAVASAKETYKLHFGNQTKAKYHVADSLNTFDKDSADLVICNPPFHQQHAIGDQVALNMFKQSHRVLRESGELWVIGNRHLNYKNQLKKIFGNVTVVAADKKFVVCKASV